jgi:hypothetical protein
MDINDIDTKDLPTTESKEAQVKLESKEQFTTSASGEVATLELQHKAIGQVLGIDDDSKLNRGESKLNTILEYVKSQTKDLSPENIKWVVREMTMRMGTPGRSESPIDYISRYCFLAMENKKINNELKTLTMGGIDVK